MINANTLFTGEPLGKSQKEFAHKAAAGLWKTSVVWQNEERSERVVNFIVELSGNVECAGTAIIESERAQAVYIAGVLDAGEFTL